MSNGPRRRIRAARLLKRVVAAPFVLLAAIIILFEDWLWDDLQRLAAAIGRLPILRQLEALITALPPYGALVLFGAPSLLLVPVKLVALYFISHGQAMLGLLTAVVAKVAGTALVARLFVLTKPKLMRIAWFAWLHDRFLAFKTAIYATIKSTAIYRLTHRRYVSLKLYLKGWISNRRGIWRRRWDASLKFVRRKTRRGKSDALAG
jgi:hypothetical protein